MEVSVFGEGRRGASLTVITAFILGCNGSDLSQSFNCSLQGVFILETSAGNLDRPHKAECESLR